MVEFKPPRFENPSEHEGKKIFCCGTIDMGEKKYQHWQSDLVKAFKKETVTFFNPRREDWDSSWQQSIDDDNFRTQVMWELEHILNSDIAVFFIGGQSKSPISLAELGLVSLPNLNGEMKVIVCCEKDFYRRGNVEVMCYKFNVPLVETFEELKDKLREQLKK